MLDRERILAKLDELEGYLSELRQVAPATFEAYKSIEKRRSCERLLRSMRGMRNVLVHEYGRVDDRLIFDAISHRLGDFDTFKKAILPALPAADAKD